MISAKNCEVVFKFFKIKPRILVVSLFSGHYAYVYAGCPTTVSITPSAGPFSAGDVLTCDANGFPEPSYQWTDSSGAVVSSTSTVTLPEGPFSLTCTATSDSYPPCSASSSISGTTESKYRKQHYTLERILMLLTLSEVQCMCIVHVRDFVSFPGRSYSSSIDDRQLTLDCEALVYSSDTSFEWGCKRLSPHTIPILHSYRRRGKFVDFAEKLYLATVV